MAKPAGRRTPTEAQRAQERRVRRRAHQVVVQQHDHHDHRPAGQRASRGRRRATSASRAPARARRSPRSSRPRPRRGAMEHGVRKVDVVVKGPGLRSRDRHPLDPERGHRSRRHQGRHARSRTTAAARRSGGGSDGALHRPVCRLCRRERMKLFLKGTKCDTMKCPIERKPYPPGQHGRGRIREASTCSSCVRSRRRAASTACSRSSSARSTTRPTGAGHHRREPAAAARAAARQRRVPRRLRAEPQPGSPVRAPRSRHRERQAGDDPVVHGAQGRRRRAARQGRSKMIVVRHNLDTHRPRRPAVARGRAPATSRRPCATSRCASRSTCRCASSSSSSSTPSSPRLPATRTSQTRVRLHADHPASRSRSRRGRGQPPARSPSRRSSPASATPSATACAARCCRRSPAPPSPRCASTTRCTSSTSSRV